MKLLRKLVCAGLAILPFTVTADEATPQPLPQIAKSVDFVEYDVLTPNMPAEVYKKFEVRAEKDDPVAMDIVFFANFMGCGRPIDRLEAQKWLPRALKAGAPLAMLMQIVNERDLFPQFTIPDYKRQEEQFRQLEIFFRNASEKGADFACYGLGACLSYKSENSERIKVLLPGAQRGNSYMQVLLAKAYYGCESHAEEQSEKWKWCQKACDRGNIKAMTWMGIFYRNDSRGKRDVEKALIFFEKAAAGGDPGAMSALSSMQDGQEAPLDKKRAFELTLKASETGYAFAIEDLVWMYTQGAGTPKDFSAALKWANVLAQYKGIISYDALFSVGCAYLNGWGVEQNWEIGIQTLEKAIEVATGPEHQFIVDTDQKSAQILFLLSEAYSMPGPHNDSQKAAQIKQKALSLDKDSVMAALYHLGLSFGKGWGVKKSASEAAVWYTLGTELGHPGCMNKLARIYDFGWGLSQDKAKAQELYEKAAKLGWREVDKTKLKKTEGAEPGKREPGQPGRHLDF